MSVLCLQKEPDLYKKKAKKKKKKKNNNNVCSVILCKMCCEHFIFAKFSLFFLIFKKQAKKKKNAYVSSITSFPRVKINFKRKHKKKKKNTKFVAVFSVSSLFFLPSFCCFIPLYYFFAFPPFFRRLSNEAEDDLTNVFSLFFLFFL